MMTPEKSITTDFRRDTEEFFASLLWVYLSNRYMLEAQGKLLRFLTLSAVKPPWWGRCTTRLLSRPTSQLAQALSPLQGDVTEEQLMKVVLEIYRHARYVGASVGDPPHFPFYLLRYGYTQEQYLADLSHLYGESAAHRYSKPWPIAVSALSIKPARPDALFDRSVAIMATTAGAIERLLTLGGGNVPNQ